ncbi:GTP cyclohydrolase 1 [Entomophthora muscae]|uniref:GTP cyclohydrolase 1 n=1 Tax=Entomophthora muscae TaxID=34485 RepID=A0ACC2SCH5_9FUNG|nr:GTP cyclohydrolase 1 [Entomophthora muscae]
MLTEIQSLSITRTTSNSDLSQETLLETKAPLKSSVIRTALPVESDGLSWPSKGTRTRANETEEEKEARLEKLSGAVRTMLECIGEDPDREGVLKTPQRYAKAMLFFTKGYEQNLNDVVNQAYV